MLHVNGLDLGRGRERGRERKGKLRERKRKGSFTPDPALIAVSHRQTARNSMVELRPVGRCELAINAISS